MGVIFFFTLGQMLTIGWEYYNNQLFIMCDIKIGIYGRFDRFAKVVSIIWRLLTWDENKIFLQN